MEWGLGLDGIIGHRNTETFSILTEAKIRVNALPPPPFHIRYLLELKELHPRPIDPLCSVVEVGVKGKEMRYRNQRITELRKTRTQHSRHNSGIKSRITSHQYYETHKQVSWALSSFPLTSIASIGGFLHPTAQGPKEGNHFIGHKMDRSIQSNILTSNRKTTDAFSAAKLSS